MSVFTGECSIDGLKNSEEPTVNWTVAVTHHFRNYECSEFQALLSGNCRILEQTHSCTTHVSAPTRQHIWRNCCRHPSLLQQVLLSFKGDLSNEASLPPETEGHVAEIAWRVRSEFVLQWLWLTARNCCILESSESWFQPKVFGIQTRANH
jgi:hypothetical protein